MLKREIPRKRGATESKEEKVTQEVVSSPISNEVAEIVIPHASQRKISVSRGVTINMGNYEFFRVDIRQERYCEDSKEASNKVLAEMSTEIAELIQAEVDEVKGA